MDWFLYDNGLRYERVKKIDCAVESSGHYWKFVKLKNGEMLSRLLTDECSNVIKQLIDEL